MPNAFRHLNALNGTLNYVRAQQAGPGAYNPGAQPTIIMPCKEIIATAQVQMWSNSGYVIVPVGLTTPHTVQYMAMTVNRNAAVGALLSHAVHAHDLLVKQNVGAAQKMNIVATDYQSQGATATIAGDAAGGGIISTVQAHAGAAAALKDIPGLEEVAINTNLAGVTVFASAWARVR